MRVARFVFSIPFVFVFCVSLSAQQTATTSAQALALLQKSFTALSGGQTLTDVTLSGTARRIAGSDDETGAGIFRALASGSSRADLNLASGQRSEVSDLSSATPAGAWSGPDRLSHPVQYHNLLSESAWFFPSFAIARRVSNPSYVATYVGHEICYGQAVEHISISQVSPLSAPAGGVSIQHLSQVDFFLDSTTFLPSSISFNIHPDDNALVDIPIEVRFSDYRSINGAQIPFHIQKYLNNGLTLDFQAQSVTLNSGLSATAFSAH